MGATIAIAKAGTIAHVHGNAAAGNIRLTGEDFAAIDQAHPPLRRKQPFAML